MEEINNFGKAITDHWVFVALGVIATRFSPIIFGMINGKVKADRELKATLEEHLQKLKDEDAEQSKKITALEEENAKKNAKLQIVTELLSGKLPDIDTLVDTIHKKMEEKRKEEDNIDDDRTAEIESSKPASQVPKSDFTVENEVI